MDGKKRHPGRPRTTPATEGAQTLLRGLDVMEAVAAGAADLAALAQALGTTRTTTHRLASALVARRYLGFSPGSGYNLGPKLGELGLRFRRALPLHQAAQPFLARLAAQTLDTVQLGILDEGTVLYLDKVPGGRPFEIRSAAGDRHPVWSTGLGKALILDLPEAQWEGFVGRGRAGPVPVSGKARLEWLERMRLYAARGVAFDLGENEPELFCVAAPIRDAGGEIVAAVSVSSLLPYMQPERMEVLSGEVRATAAEIGRSLGWHGEDVAETVPDDGKRTGRR